MTTYDGYEGDLKVIRLGLAQIPREGLERLLVSLRSSRPIVLSGQLYESMLIGGKTIAYG